MSHSPVDPLSFTDHYEVLRAWMTGQPRPVTRPAGLVLVLRQGVPGWLASWSIWLSSADTGPLPVPTHTASMASAPSLAVVLASMVEQCRQERQP